MLCGIYKITNSKTEKVYIGSSKDIKRKFRDHKRELNKGTHYNKHLQSSWNKYNEKNFSFEIVEETDVKFLLELEREYIKNFNSIEKGFNIYDADRRPDGWCHSDETKEKLREIALKTGAGKYIRTKETLDKLSNSMSSYPKDEKGNGMNDVKSILIGVETHETMKNFSKKSGMKIKFITEQAIKEFINKRSEGKDGETKV